MQKKSIFWIEHLTLRALYKLVRIKKSPDEIFYIHKSIFVSPIIFFLKKNNLIRKLRSIDSFVFSENKLNGISVYQTIQERLHLIIQEFEIYIQNLEYHY